MRKGLDTTQQLYLALMLCLGVALESFAASVCYSEQNYPSVSFLGLNEQGYPRIALTGKYLDQASRTAVVLEQSDRGWVNLGERDCTRANRCKGESRGCDVNIPKIELSVAELKRFRTFSYEIMDVDQQVGDCVRDGDDVYFGIKFYEGEGVVGLGGIGKFDTRTRKMEIRRLSPLHETSVTNLVYDGKDLWISGSSQHECIGEVPEVPLLRYNWEKDIVHPAYEIPEFCGFNVNSMVYRDNTLYIGSDMGFTVMRWKKVDYRSFQMYQWEKVAHWVPDLTQSDLAMQMSCDALYDKLLSELPVVGQRQLLQTLMDFKKHYIMDRLIESEAEQ